MDLKKVEKFWFMPLIRASGGQCSAPWLPFLLPAHLYVYSEVFSFGGMFYVSSLSALSFFN